MMLHCTARSDGVVCKLERSVHALNDGRVEATARTHIVFLGEMQLTAQSCEHPSEAVAARHDDPVLGLLEAMAGMRNVSQLIEPGLCPTAALGHAVFHLLNEPRAAGASPFDSLFADARERRLPVERAVEPEQQ
eukprot:6199126-Pleurochrysis_carterae.AAC.1